MSDYGFRIKQSFVEEHNQGLAETVEADYSVLRSQLERRGIDVESVVEDVRSFHVAAPSWAVGTGGTRFGTFPGPGEPRDVFEKLVDVSTLNDLTRANPAVSLHIPWDKPEDPDELAEYAHGLGLSFDAMNSNTFEDQPGQKLSYKFGSLTHTDRAVRQQAIEHNCEVIDIGVSLGSKAITVWIGDGGNFPGQVDFRGSFERYLESMDEIYQHLPDDWRIYVEYKPYEPAFYSTVINDWGTAHHATMHLGPKAWVLCDLGHHLPNTNIEQIISRLVQLRKLGGFHLNDSKYGDDDLTTASIAPYRLFLIFNELVQAEKTESTDDFDPCYMIDQSHNIKDPVEALIQSTIELTRYYAKAQLVDRAKLDQYRQANDVLMAEMTLKQAFDIDVTPLLQKARLLNSGAIDPVGVYRESGYRTRKAKERDKGGNE